MHCPHSRNFHKHGRWKTEQHQGQGTMLHPGSRRIFFYMLCLFQSTRDWLWGISMLGKCSTTELHPPRPPPPKDTWLLESHPPLKRKLHLIWSLDNEKDVKTDGPTGPGRAWQRPWALVLSYMLSLKLNAFKVWLPVYCSAPPRVELRTVCSTSSPVHSAEEPAVGSYWWKESTGKIQSTGDARQMVGDLKDQG